MELQNTTLDDFAAVIGFSATMRLVAWFGDRGNLYIPQQAQDGQLLVKLIGISCAKRLTQEFGGQHLNVPRLRAYENDLVKRGVCIMLEHGMSTSDVANQNRMSERRVQQIMRELEGVGLLEVSAPKITGKSAPENTPQKKGGKNTLENAPTKLPPEFFQPHGSAIFEVLDALNKRPADDCSDLFEGCDK